MVNILKLRYGKHQRSGPVKDDSVIDLKILGASRVFGDRYGREISESSNLYYVYDGHPGQVVVSLTWETLAKLRREMLRSGHFVNDADLIEAAVLHWGHEQLENTFRRGEEVPEEGYVLSFPGPDSSGARQLLERIGLV